MWLNINSILVIQIKWHLCCNKSLKNTFVEDNKIDYLIKSFSILLVLKNMMKYVILLIFFIKKWWLRLIILIYKNKKINDKSKILKRYALI